MILDRWSEWDVYPGLSGGMIFVKKNTPLWSGKAIIFSKKDGHYVVDTIIEEQGVPSFCYGTGQQLHWLMSMHYGLTVQEHSEIRGHNQGAD